MTGPAAGHRPDRPLLAILLVIGATLAFASADVLTKHLTSRYPIGVVVALRYLTSLALLLLVLWPRHRAALWGSRQRGLALARGLVLALASLTMGLALRVMPVGETVAILFLSPFAVMLLAVPLLGERVSRAGWLGATASFAGVLLILRPGGGLDPAGVALSLVNAGLATAYHLMTRHLARTETTVSLLFHVTLVGAVFFSVLALGSLDAPRPTPGDAGLMAALGVLATTGHFLFTAAYAHAPAAQLAPAQYLHLVWAGLLGWAVFAHLPDAPAPAGMLLIAAAGAAVALAARRARVSELAAPPQN